MLRKPTSKRTRPKPKACFGYPIWTKRSLPF
jgi:hypothetical protein